MWIKKSVYFLFATLMLASCSGSKSPDSIGSGSEIIVVCNKLKWDSAVGDTIRKALMQSLTGLSEAEPEFTLIFLPEQNFDKFLHTNCNILEIDINPENKTSEVETLTDIWSHPQQVIKIKAGSDTAFTNIFAKHRESIKLLFHQNERARFSAQNAFSRNLVAEKLIDDQFGLKMVVSNEFNLIRKTPDFLWLRADTSNNNIGFMIYSYPYKDTTQMNPTVALDSRDRYTKLYVPGPVAGTYMDIERDVNAPVSRKMLFKNMFAIETRGLWNTVGDFKGGPFINYTIVDAAHHRIVVFDGYVNSPNTPKRDYIRQLESIIWGAEFGEPGK